MDTSFNALGHTVKIAPQSSTSMLNQPLNTAVAIGVDQIKSAAETLQKYKQAKTNLENRIVENERWYKLRHWEYIRRNSTAKDIEPTSAWLFNALANKHADALDNFPEPNVLPREQGDEMDAKVLSTILPTVLERNGFEETYSLAWWYKLKNGTAPYGIFWDKSKENGLGDISIKKLDLLNVFWEPGIDDIQKSSNLFIVSLVPFENLKAMYPDIKDNKTTTLKVTEYIHDESIDTSDKAVIVDWYYRKNGLLHYVKFVGDTLLFASENEPQNYPEGWYAHGDYPVIFDNLFPEADMPCGFGYLDIMRDPQMYIDKVDQIVMINSAMAGKKRWFIRDDGGVNEEEYADWSKDFVHVTGSLDDRNIKEITNAPLNAFIVDHKRMKVDELKETAGNRDFNQGGTAGGVTAAAAVVALQEAGNKLSRDMIKASYRSYSQICYMVIELIRQFYDEARCFRIEGDAQAAEYIQYNNQRLQMQPLMPAYPGAEPAFRMPIFDIKVRPQKTNPFSKAAQNELALQLYQMGFFNPQLASQSLVAIEMMDFEGKTKLMQRIRENGTLFDQLQQAMMIINQLTGAAPAQEPTDPPPPGAAPDKKGEGEQKPYTKKMAGRASLDMNKPAQGVKA